MAKAFKVVEELPPPPPAKVTYTLELSEAEAIALLAVCAKIGGDPAGVRGVFSDGRDCIGTVLGEQVGMTTIHASRQLYSNGFDSMGNINFDSRTANTFKPYKK